MIMIIKQHGSWNFSWFCPFFMIVCHLIIPSPYTCTRCLGRDFVIKERNTIQHVYSVIIMNCIHALFINISWTSIQEPSVSCTAVSWSWTIYEQFMIISAVWFHCFKCHRHRSKCTPGYKRRIQCFYWYDIISYDTFTGHKLWSSVLLMCTQWPMLY